MASPTGRPLSEILANIVSINRQEYNYMAVDDPANNRPSWKTMLSGNITGLDIAEIRKNIDDALSQYAALVTEGGSGLAAYAQAQYPSVSLDIAADYLATKNAIQAMADWLKAHVPANSVSSPGGVLVGTPYQPAATAGFLALVNAAIATYQPPA